MGKTASKIVLISICVLLLFLCACSFLPEITLGARNYHSPVQLLQKADDLGLGVYGKFSITRPDDMTDQEYQSALENTISTLRDRLSTYGMQNCDVSVNDEIMIIRAPFSVTKGVSDDQKTADMLSVMCGSIGSFAVSVRTSSSSSSGTYNYTDIVTNEHVRDIVIAETGNEQTPYSCYFVFTKEGVSLLKEATKNASSANPVVLTIRVDDTDILSSSAASYTSEYDIGTLGFGSSSSEEMNVIKILALNKPLELSLASQEVFMIDGFLSDRIAYIAVAFLVIVLAFIIAMIVVYGLYGLAYAISSVSFITFVLWCFTFIYGKFFSMAGLYGIIVGFVLFALCSVLLCEKNNHMHRNTDINLDSRLKVIAGKSRKQLLFVLLKIHGAAILMSIVLWIFTWGALQSFGIVLLYASLLSLGCTLLLAPLFTTLLTNITENPKMYKLQAITNEEEAK